MICQFQVGITFKRCKWRSLVATVQLWERHSHTSSAVFGLERNVKASSTEYMDCLNPGLSFDAFIELLFSQCSFPALGSLQSHISHLTSQIEKSVAVPGSKVQQQIIHVLLDLTAELSIKRLYKRLVGLLPQSDVVAFGTRKQQLLRSSRVSTLFTGVNFKHLTWGRGRAPADKDLQEALAVLPQLKGLPNPEGLEDTDKMLCESATKLLQLGFLQIWSFHRIFVYMDTNMDTNLGAVEFDHIYR